MDEEKENFKPGDIAVITGRLYGHEFAMGQKVKIIRRYRHSKDFEGIWTVSGIEPYDGTYVVSEDEISKIEVKKCKRRKLI